MVTPSERQRLEEAYRGPVYPWRTVAKCAVGLLVLVGLAALGVATVEDEQTAATSLSAPRVANGR